MTLDQIDTSIVRHLSADGRLTISELAEVINLSASACSRRVLRLEKDGVITGYHAKIDPLAIGIGITALISITLDGQGVDKMVAFEKAVCDIPQVLECYSMAGNYDYILRVAARDLVDFEHVHRHRIAELPYVARATSNFAMKKILLRDSAII